MSQALEGKEVLGHGYPRDIESKQFVAVGGLEPAYEGKQVNSVVMGPPGNVERPRSEAPPKPESVPRYSRGRWTIGGFVILILLMVVAVPVGVIFSRNRR